MQLRLAGALAMTPAAAIIKWYMAQHGHAHGAAAELEALHEARKKHHSNESYPFRPKL